MSGTLSIVGTPIGNLGDITLRALETFKKADVVFCEDTRVTTKLLSHYEIKVPLKRLDAHTEVKNVQDVVNRLSEGQRVVYVTDAGTPTISDPGARLVAAVRQALGDSFPIEAIPGPSALTAALSIAGVSADSFIFLGFLPHKKGRQTLLKSFAQEERAIVLYESTHRILKLLTELSSHVPERELTVVREITKKFEEVKRGQAGALLEFFTHNPEHTRGEFVVIVAPL